MSPFDKIIVFLKHSTANSLGEILEKQHVQKTKKGEKLKFNVVRCKYAKLYRPGKENAVDKKIIELKNIISGALKGNVKSNE
jgi:hypothetical protein